MGAKRGAFLWRHDWSFIYSIGDHFATRFLYFLIDDLERMQGCTPFCYIFLQPYLIIHMYLHITNFKNFKATSYRQALALHYPMRGANMWQYIKSDS